jgi:predicted pyridoxine 5'-phosphate oxidase superfamily flavin-nucleotide-binding protein
VSRYQEIAFTPAVRAEQHRHGSDRAYRLDDGDGAPDPLGELERDFITSRDSFFMASINEDGWPYMQHRGGPPGFLHVLDDHTVGFADFRGNRQYVSVGNLAGDDRVALFFMDYPRRIRLKAFGHARVVEAADNPALIARLSMPDYPARVERAMVITIEGTDWNCSQHIPQLLPAEDVRAALRTLQRRIDELEDLLNNAGGGTG